MKGYGEAVCSRAQQLQVEWQKREESKQTLPTVEAIICSLDTILLRVCDTVVFLAQQWSGLGPLDRLSSCRHVYLTASSVLPQGEDCGVSISDRSNWLKDNAIHQAVRKMNSPLPPLCWLLLCTYSMHLILLISVFFFASMDWDKLHFNYLHLPVVVTSVLILS